MFILHTLWEFWQIIIGMSRPYSLSGSSNLIDTFVDAIVFMSGAVIAKFLFRTINTDKYL